MRLFVFNKNGAQVADLTLADGPVPRAGEELALPAYANDCDGMSEFLVTAVVWMVQGDRLEAEVTCQAMSAEHLRLLMLREAGWVARDDIDY